MSSFFFSLFFFFFFFLPLPISFFFLEISLFHRSIPLINRFSQIHLSIRIREVKTNRFWSHVTHGFTINIDHDHDSCPYVVIFLFFNKIDIGFTRSEWKNKFFFFLLCPCVRRKDMAVFLMEKLEE